MKNGFAFLQPKNKGVRKLNVAETRMLGNRQFLVMAEYEGRKMLLGVCPGRIELLSDLGGKTDEPFAAHLERDRHEHAPFLEAASICLALSLVLLALFVLALPALAQAPAATPDPVAQAPATAAAAQSLPINITIGTGSEQGNVSSAIQIVFVMTLLTLAPSIMMLMTSFTRHRHRPRLRPQRARRAGRAVESDHRRAVALPHHFHHGADRDAD